MAVNKVVMNTENGENTLIDLTSDTVTAETLAEGTRAHDASGNVITGVGKTTSVLYTAQTLTDEQKAQARANIGIVGSLQVELTSTGITDDETGLLVFGANKSVSECIEAFENGVPVYGSLDPTGNAFGGVMVSCLDGLVVFEVANSLNVAKRYMLLGMNDGENDIWLGTYSDGATMADIPTPLSGLSTDITPTQVYEAMSSGRETIIAYTDKTFGLLYFTNFNVAISLGVVFSSAVVQYGNAYGLCELIGDFNTNTWRFVSTQIAQYSDIPTALKNPHALTINGTAYDGSKAVNMTDTINAMIDAKLGVIENGSY